MGAGIGMREAAGMRLLESPRITAVLNAALNNLPMGDDNSDD
jgi:hypothetical protein